MSHQSTIDLTTNTKSGPVECLGQSFESDEARRAHYLELLREKLKDPEFRKIEGFPIGEDEDILNLSDPPYYTACPNPWIGDFIKYYGKPYDPKEKYHREPFAADVSEGKNHPIYNAHSYHTKVPHRAIMRYILHYTEPGDVVFDGFCGTGMTGVAAQLCGDEKEVRALGYRVDVDGTIYNEEGKGFSKLGARRAVLNDLSPAATFIAYNYNTPVDVEEFEKEAKRILDEVEGECGWMYETRHTDGSIAGIDYVIWSEMFSCHECGHEIVFLEEAMDAKTKRVEKEFPCPNCGLLVRKSQMQRSFEKYYDTILGESTKRPKRSPVDICYRIGKTKYRKKPDSDDLEIINKVDFLSEPFNEIPTKAFHFEDMWEAPRMKSRGVSHVHHLFLQRQARILDAIWTKIEAVSNYRVRQMLKFWLDQSIPGMSVLNRYQPIQHGRDGGSQVNRQMSGVYYIPSQISECSPRYNLTGKLDRLKKAFANPIAGKSTMIKTESSVNSETPDGFLDYIFIDPPFGDNFAYSELNFMIEAWLGAITNSTTEAIVDRSKENRSVQKSLDQYRQLILSCLLEANRMLKPGRWLTVEFSNTKSSVWNSIQSALAEAGFVVANVSALDKKQGTFKAVTTTTAVKQDLVISAYKPNGGLEKRFAQHGDSVKGVWDFLQTHLRNLPVVKPRGGQLERIAERDPRILYDRMVAFYIGHNTPVPLSSGEFQAALHEKYPERDGMVFLPEQVAEYDKKASQMENVGQLTIFVEDEKSAINWLRQFLKDRPSVNSDITPEFMQQLSASWKKFETRPELSLLLDQNFIKYTGEGDVPSQIHSYLSTNFKDLRGKDKEDPALKAKAWDRWYVPDPKKAVDVEAIRDKRLLAEFWAYAEQAGVKKRKPGDSNQTTLPMTEPAAPKKGKVRKLKEVRTEAIRIGFLECHRNKDAATILAIAQILPQNVIEEDEQLQMIYDMAEMRAE